MVIDVLIPVLGRPQRARPLLESLRAASPATVRPLFLVSPADWLEMRAIQELRAPMLVVGWEPGRGDYARKMNAGFAATDGDFVFLAADDIRFHPGWAEAAIAKWAETGAGVVGTNDLGNSRVISGDHATHALVHRDYGQLGTIDEPDKLLHEGYWHNFVDDELIGTAKHRGAFASAADSVVEHLHPAWGKADHDDTYRRASQGFYEDRLYFDVRRRLWGGSEWQAARLRP